jgi:hypothetical protein
MDMMFNFDCFIVSDGRGGYIIMYKMKNGQPDQVGVQFVANGD